MTEFSADVAHETLLLNAEFLASEPERRPVDKIRVFVLITPHVAATSNGEIDDESCPDLLAPRNVLNRHAAHHASSPSVCCSWNEPVQSSEDTGTLELLTDDLLLEGGEGIDAFEVLLTPEDDLLSPEPSVATRVESAKLFLIKRSDQGKRNKKRRPHAPLSFGGVEIGR